MFLQESRVLLQAGGRISLVTSGILPSGPGRWLWGIRPVGIPSYTGSIRYLTFWAWTMVLGNPSNRNPFYTQVTSRILPSGPGRWFWGIRPAGIPSYTQVCRAHYRSVRPPSRHSPAYPRLLSATSTTNDFSKDIF